MNNNVSAQARLIWSHGIIGKADRIIHGLT